MRLPNGYGSVYKLSGKRRKPYIVKKFDKWEMKDGKAIAKYTILGYTTTKKEGLEMLAKFNENPFDVSTSTYTFAQVFELFKKEKYPKISEKNRIGYNASFNACESIHNCIFRDLKYQDLQEVINNSDKNYPTLKKIKTLYNQLYKYALKRDICTRDYAQYVSVSEYKDKNPNKYAHTIFTMEELDILWNNKHNIYVQVILILIYTGLRISTLLDLKKSNVHIDEEYLFIEKDKTEKSIRKVPIAQAIMPFIKEWYERSQCEYLICTLDNKHFTYRNYKDSYWHNIFPDLGMSDHLPHDTRHTCSTLMKLTKSIDELNRKKILGHTSQDVTNDVYTHIDIKYLIEDINKIHPFVESELANIKKGLE